MALYAVTYNTITGKQRALSSGGRKDADYTATAAQVNFKPAAGVTLASDSLVDVFVDGRLQNPSSYTVNTGSNRIEITGGATLGVWVRVRVLNV